MKREQILSILENGIYTGRQTFITEKDLRLSVQTMREQLHKRVKLVKRCANVFAADIRG